MNAIFGVLISIMLFIVLRTCLITAWNLCCAGIQVLGSKSKPCRSNKDSKKKSKTTGMEYLLSVSALLCLWFITFHLGIVCRIAMDRKLADAEWYITFFVIGIVTVLWCYFGWEMKFKATPKLETEAKKLIHKKILLYFVLFIFSIFSGYSSMCKEIYGNNVFPEIRVMNATAIVGIIAFDRLLNQIATLKNMQSDETIFRIIEKIGEIGRILFLIAEFISIPMLWIIIEIFRGNNVWSSLVVIIFSIIFYFMYKKEDLIQTQAQYGPTCGYFNILFAAQYFGMDVDFNDIAKFIAEQRDAGKTHLGEIFDIEILYEAAKTFILNVEINLVPYRVVKPDKDTVYILPVMGATVLHYNTVFLDENESVRFYTGKSKAEHSFLWCKFCRHKRIPDTFNWGKYNASEAKRSKQKQKKIIKSRKKISAGYEESAALLESFFAAERERKEIVPVKAKGYMIKISRKIDKKKENFS